MLVLSGRACTDCAPSIFVAIAMYAMALIQQLQQLKTSLCAAHSAILTYLLSLYAIASEALKANTSLETIYLNRNQIGDEGAKALAEVHGLCPSE